MNRTLVAFEPVCEGVEHAPFNAGLLSAVLTIVDRVIFFGEAAHLDAVREILDAWDRERVDWRTVQVAPRSVQTIAGRFRHEWRVLREVGRAAQLNDAVAVIGTGVSEAGLVAIKLRALIGRANRPVGVVFHSILGYFLSGRTQRRLLALGNRANVRFLVPGESLKALVQSIVPALAPRLRSFTHPYSFASAPEQASRLSDSIIRFGFLGVATRGKGFPQFLDIAASVASTQVRFELVGRVGADCELLIEEFQRGPHASAVTLPAANERLPTKIYRERLKELSYAVFPYDVEAYKFVRSGAALDAVWAAKPLIALRIPALEELFDRLGDIGYLCRDPDEMRATIVEIARLRPFERYDGQSRSLIRGRELFGAAAVGRELRQALDL